MPDPNVPPKKEIIELAEEFRPKDMADPEQRKKDILRWTDDLTRAFRDMDSQRRRRNHEKNKR